MYQVISASVRGTAHLENNQDACFTSQHDGFVIGIVADGCSDGKYSHAGAGLMCSMLGGTLSRMLSSSYPARSFQSCLDSSVRRVCAHIELMSAGDWGSRSAILKHFMMFTIVGCAVTPDKVYYFHLGDGCIINHTLWQNDESVYDCGIYNIDKNKPPYLGARLADGNNSIQDLSFHAFSEDLADFQFALIGSDGALDLIQKKDRCFPGTDETIGSIDQFWTEERYFDNLDNLRRTLFLINRDAYSARLTLAGKPAIQRRPGLLSDDTTIIVIRRPPSKEEKHD